MTATETMSLKVSNPNSRLADPTSLISATHTVLVASDEPLRREFLSGVIRRRVGCRVVEAAGVTESRYLAAVEGSIHVILLSFRSAEEEQLALARWFRTAHPESKVIVASGSLWELSGEPNALEQVLMAKSYTPAELASTIRRLLGENGPAISEPAARPFDNAPSVQRTVPSCSPKTPVATADLRDQPVHVHGDDVALPIETLLADQKPAQ